MEDKKDLGKLIKQRLADAEAEPANDLWATIEKTLDQKRKRRVGFFWLWGGAVALFGILMLFYFTSNTTPAQVASEPKETIPTSQEDSLVDSETPTKQTQIQLPKNKTIGTTTQDSTTEKPIAPLSTTVSDFQPIKGNLHPGKKELRNDQKQASENSKKRPPLGREEASTTVLSAKTHQRSTKALSKPNFKNSADENANASAGAPFAKTNGKTALAKTTHPKVSDSVESATKEVNKDSILAKILTPKKPLSEEEEDETLKKILDPSKWLFSVQIAPNYYDYLSTGNPFEESLSTGKTQGTVSLAYGVLINMPISDKFTFRFGYRRSNLKLTVKNAVSGQDVLGGNPLFRDAAIARNAVPIPTSISDSINNGGRFKITQELSYNQIPFETYYTFYKDKITIDAIAGINILLLGKNTIAISNNTGSVTIGSGRYLKKVAIAPTIGLGLRYQLNEKIRIDFEPVFRYHSNTFDNAYKNRRPYTLGVQTGLTLKL